MFVQNLKLQASAELAQGPPGSLLSTKLASISSAVATGALTAHGCSYSALLCLSHPSPHSLDLEALQWGAPWSLLLPHRTKPRAKQSSGCASRPGV